MLSKCHFRTFSDAFYSKRHLTFNNHYLQVSQVLLPTVCRLL